MILDSFASRVEVIDYGVGIEPRHLPRLTERFYRVDDHRSRELGGTGLGLAITRKLARLMGGDVTVSSEPDVGSMFDLTLLQYDEAHRVAEPIFEQKAKQKRRSLAA